ncbi:MAG: hypothetical protein IBX72_16080 [Nitrospirae bacterium]|nr:hypothetical protein [Nitrospirota bacterium]
MDHQGMELNELINKVKAKLRDARYSDSCIRGFATVWNRLTDYMIRNSKTIFTAKIGMNFLETEYGITIYKELILKKKALCQSNQFTYRLSTAWNYLSQNQTGNTYLPCTVSNVVPRLYR